MFEMTKEEFECCENAERQKHDEKVKELAQYGDSYGEKFRQYEERIEKLEKENVDLRERADKADLDSVTFFNQLCKAKEIIKEWLQWANDDIDCPKFQEIEYKSEDFIKELDK